MPRLMTVKVSPNLSCSSRRHWSVRLAGVTISVRSTSPRNFSSLMRQPGHDRLAGARVVGDQEADAGLGEQVRVDGIHLVRQRIDLRHGDGEVRVVLEGQPDAVGFGGEAEVRRVAVERGQLAGLGDLDRAVEVLGLEQLRSRAAWCAGRPPGPRSRVPRALAVSTLTGSVQCGPSRVAPSASCRRISSMVMSPPVAAVSLSFLALARLALRYFTHPVRIGVPVVCTSSPFS